MADGLPRLILFSIAMATASFAAGMLPLSLSLSKNKLRLLSTVGMGVLVGTSLIVIIPEGIETLYNAAATPTSSHLDRREDGHAHGHSHDLDHDDDDDDHGSSSPHAYIGLALIAGFILMYLIDTLPALVQQHTSPSQPSYINLNALRTPNPNTDPHSSNGDAPRPTSSSSSPTPSSSSFSTTTGLVIHACADGIALGASSTSSNLGLELIIFIAIMLHKAPAAFGLSAVLLKKGLGKRTARAHLVVFSLAAPFGALVTWAIIVIAGGVGDKQRMAWWTGVLLLFSGGTFLYVAMHTMQESTAGSHGHGDADDRDGLEEEGYMMAPKKHGHTGPSVQDTAAAVVGMLVPLVTQIGHSHAHAH